jgi:hypothetical protein
MVVERGCCGRKKKKSGADSYVDQFFGDGLFEVNTWTNSKPTMMYHSNI